MIRKKNRNSKKVIDLTGPEGNAFVLMGYGKRAASQLGLDWGPIQADMMSSDYDHLLEVFEQHFGDHFILEQ